MATDEDDDCEEAVCGHDEWTKVTTFASGMQIEVCRPCPWNSIGNGTYCECNPGYYSVYDINDYHEIDEPGYNDWYTIYGEDTLPPNSELSPPMYCARCPNGAHCAEQGTTVYSVTSNEAYFAGTDGSNFEFFPCLNDACMDYGGCAEGYTGETCAECTGDLRPVSDFECSDCSLGMFALVSFLIDVGLFIFVFIYYYKRINATNNENKQRTQAEFVYLKIIMSFMQVNALLARFDFDLGGVVAYGVRVMKEVTSTGFAWVEYGCVFKGSSAPVFIIKSLMAFSLPAILSVFWIGTLYVVDKMTGSKLVAKMGDNNGGIELDASPEEGKEEGGDEKEAPAEEAPAAEATEEAPAAEEEQDGMESDVFYAGFTDQVLACGSLFFYYLYPFLAEQSGRVFTCVRTGHGVDDNFMADDLSIQCWGSGHWALVFMIWIPMTAVYTVGVPVITSLMIRWNKNNITYLAANNDILLSGDKETAEAVRDSYAELVLELKEAHNDNWKAELDNIELSANQFLMRFGWYFFGYKPEHINWEDMIFARKLGIITIACMLNHDPILQSMSAIALLVVAVAAHERYKPICIPLLNDFEFASIIASLGLFFAGTLTQGNNITTDIAQITCFVFGGCYGAFAVYIFIQFAKVEITPSLNLDDVMGTAAADDEAQEPDAGCSVM